MSDFVIVGSVAWDEVVRLESPLRAGSHNDGRWQGGRIGGGAANMAMALARTGHRVRVLSAVGRDTPGDALTSELADIGVDLSLMTRGAPETTRSLVMLDAAGERTVVNLARAKVPLPNDMAEISTDWFYVRSADPALRDVLVRRVAGGGRVLAHVPPLESGCRPAQVLVGSASDLDRDFLANPFAAGRRIAGECLEWMVLTYGPGGARAYSAEGVIEQPAQPVTVVDSTGAGDVFAAGLLHALADGKDMAAALAVAVHWGTASVTYVGTVPPASFPGNLISASGQG